MLKNTPDATIALLAIVNNNAPADGVSTDSVIAQVSDGTGNFLPGQSVTFTATGGVVIDSPIVSDARGMATATLSSQTEGKVIVTASINTSHKDVEVNFTTSGGENNPGAVIDFIGITLDNADANGTAVNEVTVFVTDGSNNSLLKSTPLAEQSVTFLADNGAVITSPAITDSGGLATTTLYSFTPGSSQVTASINNSQKSTTVTFTGEGNNPDAVIDHIEVISDLASANSEATNIVSALIVDGTGTPLGGQGVMFSASNGATVVSPVISDDSGMAITTLTSLTQGISSVTATINSSTQSLNVTFTAEVDPGASILSLVVTKNDARPDGISTDEVLAVVIDANGNTLAGQVVSFTVSDNADITPSALSDENGHAIATLTSTTGGTKAVAATINDSSREVEATFIDAAIFTENFSTQTATVFVAGKTYPLADFDILAIEISSGGAFTTGFNSGDPNAGTRPNGMGLGMGSGSMLQFNLHHSPYFLTMTIGDLGPEQLTVEYYAADDELLYSRIYTSADNQITTASYTAPEDKVFTYVKLYLNSAKNYYIWIDDVSGNYCP
ncbi:Ig-like domain-containing protein [Kluyvera intermedia]|uniref:Ig-like domain-containing protein n=1 Tax=Kluyvera intermedia TaxID=61648 RepID=UPI003524FBA4